MGMNMAWRPRWRVGSRSYMRRVRARACLPLVPQADWRLVKARGDAEWAKQVADVVERAGEAESERGKSEAAAADAVSAKARTKSKKGASTRQAGDVPMPPPPAGGSCCSRPAPSDVVDPSERKRHDHGSPRTPSRRVHSLPSPTADQIAVCHTKERGVAQSLCALICGSASHPPRWHEARSTLAKRGERWGGGGGERSAAAAPRASAYVLCRPHRAARSHVYAVKIGEAGDEKAKARGPLPHLVDEIAWGPLQLPSGSPQQIELLVAFALSGLYNDLAICEAVATAVCVQDPQCVASGAFVRPPTCPVPRTAPDALRRRCPSPYPCALAT